MGFQKEPKKIWDLSFAKIKKLRKEICLNSLFLEDYNNSLGIDPHEAMSYFDQYFSFLLDQVELSRGRHKKLSDTEKINRALQADTWENLKFFHLNYDRL